MNSSNVISENSDVALTAHLLVKFTATGVDKCGTGDRACGTVLNDTLINTPAAVALRKNFGIHYVTTGSATAIVAGDELEQGALGTVVKFSAGTKIGVAREPASATGSIIRAYLYSSPTV
jgi:hypothetical protein